MSRRTTCPQANGRLRTSVSELACGQGVPLRVQDLPSGPTPGPESGVAAGSQSPGGPRADKPRVGWQTGRASARAGGQGVPLQDRSPGLKIWGGSRAAIGSRPTSGKAEAIGRTGPRPDSGGGQGPRRRPGPTTPLTLAALKGHHTDRPCPAAARSG